MRLTLEVDSAGPAPLRGTLQAELGDRRPFAGWLELMTLLDEILSLSPGMGEDRTLGDLA
jgi:hypothetical protein